MEKKVNALHALFVIFALCIPVYCNADTIGFDNSSFAPPPAPVTSPVVSNPSQNNAVASNAVPNNSDNASTADAGVTTPNAHTIAAVGYHSLPQNLAPQAPIVLAKNTDVGDCKDSEGAGVKSSGAFSEETACPLGYIAYAIETTQTPNDANRFTRFINTTFGPVYYHLRCCKARVVYS